MPLLLLLLLLLLFNPFLPTLLALNASDEALALLSFKSSIQSDPTNSLSNWVTSYPQPNPCSFNGVTCNKLSAVISLSLPKSHLLGPLHPSLFSRLPSLRHLNLRNNRLHGPLPPSLPSASALQSLVLSSNSLSGPLPSRLANLSSLQILDLSSNSLTGIVPASLLQCRRLKTLDLSRNNFSGPLPVGFGGALIQLEKLDLSWNSLNGSIPGDLGNLSNLQGTADFSHNSFSGSVPASLGELPEKVYIDLSYNHLSGPIPQNGALVNRGPTAFIGNPGLCGPPLKTPCSSTVPSAPSSSDSISSSKGLSRGAVVAIVVSDVAGIGLMALVFFYCYRRAVSKDEGSRASSRSTKGGRKECLCFSKEDSSEAHSESVEQQNDLVPLDRQLGFDLDELLKASAFVLGKSGIGIVYKVVLDDGLTLAVRRLGEGGSQRFKEFRSEVEAIGKVRHHNIVTLRAYYWSIDEKLLIYDYIPNGNLSTALHGGTGSVEFQPLSWDIRLTIMRGIAKGLAHLHEVSPKKYVHGDLKPNNILLGLKMEPYISDFGVGRLANIAGGGSPLLHQSSRMASTDKPQSDVSMSPMTAMALSYQAPEALKTLKPSQKWDVYSYGVILLELISGRSPMVLMETSDMDLVRWVQLCIEEKKPLADVLDPCLSHELDAKEDVIIAVLKIALTCVQANPERRPTMRSVLDALEKLIDAS